MRMFEASSNLFTANQEHSSVLFRNVMIHWSQDTRLLPQN